MHNLLKNKSKYMVIIQHDSKITASNFIVSIIYGFVSWRDKDQIQNYLEAEMLTNTLKKSLIYKTDN